MFVTFQELTNIKNVVWANCEGGEVMFLSEAPLETDASLRCSGTYQKLSDGSFLGVVNNGNTSMLMYKNTYWEIKAAKVQDDTDSFIRFFLGKIGLCKPLIRLEVVTSSGETLVINDDGFNQDFDYEDSVNHVFDILDIVLSNKN